jgi:hypothetical protein
MITAIAVISIVAVRRPQFLARNSREQLLVQSLADIDWPLDRVPCIVSGLMGIARDEYNELHPHHETKVVEAAAYLRFERELKNLSIQETRLRRMRQQDLAELVELQAARQKKEEEQAKTTRQSQPQSAPQPKEQSAPASPSSEIGFEFETTPEAAKGAA